MTLQAASLMNRIPVTKGRTEISHVVDGCGWNVCVYVVGGWGGAGRGGGWGEGREGERE